MLAIKKDFNLYKSSLYPDSKKLKKQEFINVSIHTYKQYLINEVLKDKSLNNKEKAVLISVLNKKI